MKIVASVHGKVQGVGFRYWCHHQFDRLGLDGTARNETDGTVTVQAKGESWALDELEQLIRSKAPGLVTGVTAHREK